MSSKDDSGSSKIEIYHSSILILEWSQKPEVHFRSKMHAWMIQSVLHPFLPSNFVSEKGRKNILILLNGLFMYLLRINSIDPGY